MTPSPTPAPVALPPTPHVVVADALRSPDPLVRALRDALAKGADPDGRLHAYDGSLPAVSVHRDSVPRALRVLDAVVKGGRKLGLEFRAHERYRKRSLHVVVEGEPVPFGLKEKYRQERVPPPKGASSWDRGRLVYHSTGRLSLGLGHDHSAGYRRVIGDTTKVRVEDRVGEFLVALYAEAAKQREDRERAEQFRRDFEREQEAKRAAERERALDKARRDALEARAADLETSLRVAALIDEVERRAAAVALTDEEAQALAGWVRWARDHADRLDPLAHGLPPWPDPVPEARAAWWAR